LTTTLSYRKSA